METGLWGFRAPPLSKI